MHTNSPSTRVPSRLKRSYFSEHFQMQQWSDIEPFVQELIDRPISSAKELERWMYDCDEADRIIGENARWRHINVTCHTANDQYQSAYNEYVAEILPKLRPMTFKIHCKVVKSPFLVALDAHKYQMHLRNVQNSVRLFREENIALFSELALLEKEYQSIVGGLSVQIDGQEKTMQAAASLLSKNNRRLRETAFRAINEKWLGVADTLNNLFDKMVALRHQIALNAGFSNFRDYKFAALGRFDYTPEDCMAFHQTIEQEVVPLLCIVQERHKEASQIHPYRPWDTDAPLDGNDAPSPFANVEELTEKTIACLDKVSTEFGNCLRVLKQIGHLDLESRKNKAPGGYNASLPEMGIPFIFMNAVGTIGDVKTMVHESGHAVHTFLSRHLELGTLKQLTSEIAELASMSMELMTMEHWNIFFANEADLKKAKIQQLERILSILPWVSVIDSFQHWIYTHPKHTQAERQTAWLQTLARFSNNLTDWEGIEYIVLQIFRYFSIFAFPT